MSKKIVAANWKMNNDEYSSKSLAYEFLKLLNHKNNLNTIKILCVPFPFLSIIDNMCQGAGSVFVGAQNCSPYDEGAYTGEVSAKMLKSLNIPYVIIGHSERRELFFEKSKDLILKAKVAIENKIKPIFCCGEPLDIREKNDHINFVINQLEETIFSLDSNSFSKITIAYEPIWAIGSGKTATNEEIQEMHSAIRKSVKKQYGSSISKNVSILYGGSVKSINAKEIFDLEDVDGGLIGGASLDAREFIDIVNSIS